MKCQISLNDQVLLFTSSVFPLLIFSLLSPKPNRTKNQPVTDLRRLTGLPQQICKKSSEMQENETEDGIKRLKINRSEGWMERKWMRIERFWIFFPFLILICNLYNLKRHFALKKQPLDPQISRHFEEKDILWI